MLILPLTFTALIALHQCSPLIPKWFIAFLLLINFCIVEQMLSGQVRGGMVVVFITNNPVNPKLGYVGLNFHEGLKLSHSFLTLSIDKQECRIHQPQLNT